MVAGEIMSKDVVAIHPGFHPYHLLRRLDPASGPDPIAAGRTPEQVE